MNLCDYGCCPREVRDWFCGAGGAAEGLHRAWPHSHIVGYDIKPQKRYPFDFVQCDWSEAPLDGDFYWASPPCQGYSTLRTMWNVDAASYRRLIRPVRERLYGLSKTPFVIENVPGSELANPIILCGSMFGLGTGKYQLRRHRCFESTHLVLTPRCRHQSPTIGIFGDHARDSAVERQMRGKGACLTKAQASEAMGIDWMTGDELSQAVPPAYSEYIARQLTAAIQAQAA